MNTVLHTREHSTLHADTVNEAYRSVPAAAAGIIKYPVRVTYGQTTPLQELDRLRNVEMSFSVSFLSRLLECGCIGLQCVESSHRFLKKRIDEYK